MTTTLIDANGQPPTIRRGTTPVFTFAVKNEDDTPKNLTGATEVSFAIARSRGARAYDLVIPLGGGTSHDGEDGNVTVVFTKEQTEALPYGDRWCELWIMDNAGRRDLVGDGRCTILDTLVTVT